jgi:hypothetical protein
MRAVIGEFRAAARPIVSRAGARWPAELEEAVMRYLSHDFGWPG